MVFATVAKRGVALLLLNVLLFVYLKVILSTDSSGELICCIDFCRILRYIYLFRDLPCLYFLVTGHWYRSIVSAIYWNIKIK